MRKSALLTLIGLLAVFFIWALLGWQPTPEKSTGHQALGLAEAPSGGDFVLDSYRGPVSLEDLRGKVVALYFGYTWCPDICPTSLALMSAALSELQPEQLQRVVNRWAESYEEFRAEEIEATAEYPRDLMYELGKAGYMFLAGGQGSGLVKMLADEESDEILGVHILGANASEMIAECVVAMEFQGSSEDLARIVHAHPTLSEAIHEAALNLDGRAIHRGN